ncbi:MAG TPA: hypothetical protein VF748_05035, partial [Candidatus Acidoferrum sp.]
MSAAFERYIGIDYSGAETCESGLKGLRVCRGIARPNRAKSRRLLAPQELDAQGDCSLARRTSL